MKKLISILILISLSFKILAANPTLAGNNVFTGANTFGSLYSSAFSGSGAGIINISGVNITPGTINSNKLDAATLALFNSGGSGTNSVTGVFPIVASGNQVSAPSVLTNNQSGVSLIGGTFTGSINIGTNYISGVNGAFISESNNFANLGDFLSMNSGSWFRVGFNSGNFEFVNGGSVKSFIDGSGVYNGSLRNATNYAATNLFSGSATPGQVPVANGSGGTVYTNITGSGTNGFASSLGQITISSSAAIPLISATNTAGIAAGTIVTVPIVGSGTNIQIAVKYGTVNALGGSTNAGVFILGDTSGIAPDPSQVGYPTNSVRSQTNSIATSTGAFTVITNLTLTPGVWMISGNAGMVPTAAGTYSNFKSCITTSTGTIIVDGFDGASGVSSASQTVVDTIAIPFRVVTVLSPSTYNLIGFCAFLTGSVSYYGEITAFRLR